MREDDGGRKEARICRRRAVSFGLVPARSLEEVLLLLGLLFLLLGGGGGVKSGCCCPAQEAWKNFFDICC